MRLNAVKILKINITIDSKETILEEVRKGLENGSGGKGQGARCDIKDDKKFIIIHTPNPEQVVLARDNEYFRDLLNQADVTLPDGIGLIIAQRLLNGSGGKDQRAGKFERISGVDFMEDLVSLANKEGFRIAIIGGDSGVALKALECLQKNNKNLIGWAQETPSLEVRNNKLEVRTEKVEIISPDGSDIDKYTQQLARKIMERDTRMVFVGLGAPKQEMIIDKLRTEILKLRTNKEKINKKSNSKSQPLVHDDPYLLLLMSVGGAFDMISGRIQRAPLIYRKVGFEWIWRLAQEPWRWRRQLALMKFVGMVGREFISRLKSGEVKLDARS